MGETKHRFLLVIAFFSGLSIMAIEISAARLLAPYYGTSVFVWTNVIGVVMLALSLGYYYGGKLADQRPELKLLLRLILVAGIFFLVVPWFIKPIASFVTSNAFLLESGTVVIFISSLIVSIVLFALPITLLGMVSPYIIKLYSLVDKPIGEIAGSVFAVSTMGSILGTFLPTLYLIPTFGTRLTVTIFALVLIILAAFGLFQKKSKLVILVVLLMPLPILGKTSIRPDANLVYETESAYQYIKVAQVDEHTRYLQFNEGSGIQSSYTDNDYLTGWMYFDYVNLLPYLVEKDHKNGLIIGLAGGAISRQWNHFFPGEIDIDGVEIDAKVIDTAKKYFELENPDLTIHHQDGRIFVDQSTEQYDLVVIDAYANQLYIPWTLTTDEFWQSVKDITTEEGVIYMNINASSSDSDLLVSISNTISKTFENVYVIRVDDALGWNYLLFGSNADIDIENLDITVRNPVLEKYALHAKLNAQKIEFDASKPVLTDDWAPVEFMTDKMIYSYILDNFKQ